MVLWVRCLTLPLVRPTARFRSACPSTTLGLGGDARNILLCCTTLNSFQACPPRHFLCTNRPPELEKEHHSGSVWA